MSRLCHLSLQARKLAFLYSNPALLALQSSPSFPTFWSHLVPRRMKKAGNYAANTDNAKGIPTASGSEDYTVEGNQSVKQMQEFEFNPQNSSRKARRG